MGKAVKKEESKWIKYFYKYIKLSTKIERITQNALKEILADAIISDESEDRQSLV